MIPDDQTKKRVGNECWGNCGQGPCEYCGSMGYCCRKNYTDITDNDNSFYDGGCDGTFGGENRHECSIKPGKLIHCRYENSNTTYNESLLKFELLCNIDVILEATCDDNIQNQGEEQIDCGGPCPSCPTCKF